MFPHAERGSAATIAAMLATLAALQLVLAPVSAPPTPIAPDEARRSSAADEDRPPPPAPPPSAEAAPGEAPPPAEKPSETAAAERRRQRSLLSAEPLNGGSAALAWAGWSSLGAIYAIGFTARDDAGPFLDYDWAKSESRIGVLYRRPLSKAGRFDMAGRLALSWYTNFGSDYVYGKNHSDHGVDVTPGIALSQHGAGGIFSILAEAPMTVTTKYGNGFLFAPRASLAFEMPLYEDVTLGARVGLGYRAGAGDAPLREGRAELQFLVLAGYQVL